MQNGALLQIGYSQSNLNEEPQPVSSPALSESGEVSNEKYLGVLWALAKHQHVLSAYAALLFYFLGLSLSGRFLSPLVMGLCGVFGGVLGFSHFYVYSEDLPRLRTVVLFSMLFYAASAGALSATSAETAADLEIIFGPVGLLLGSSVGASVGFLIACELYGSPALEQGDTNDDPDQEFHGAYGDLWVLLYTGLFFTEMTMILGFAFGLSSDVSMDKSLLMGLVVGVGMSSTLIVPYVAIHSLLRCALYLLERHEEKKAAGRREEKVALPAVELNGGQVRPDGSLVVVTNGYTHSKRSWGSALMRWVSKPKKSDAYLDGDYRPDTPRSEAFGQEIL